MKQRDMRITLGAALMAVIFPVAALAGVGEKPGERFDVKFEDLPEPSKGIPNPPKRIERGDHQLLVPEGFEISVFADDLTNPRYFAIAPNGDIFISEPEGRFVLVEGGNKITVLRDQDGDGVADLRATFADGFTQPQGMAFVEGALLVADPEGVWRLPYEEGALSAESRERVTAEGVLSPETGSHWQRNLILDPDGEHMFVSVGSKSNIAEDPLPHASVQRFRLDG